MRECGLHLQFPGVCNISCQYEIELAAQVSQGVALKALAI